MGGRKLARLAGIWAFDVYQPNQIANKTFAEGLVSWSKAAEATNHLFYAFLRTMIPPPGAPISGPIVKLPKSLETLLVSSTYPPLPLYKSRLIAVPMVSLTVGRLSADPHVLLKRVAKTIRFDNSTLYNSEDDFNTLFYLFSDPNSVEMKITPESRRILDVICDQNPLMTDHSLYIKDSRKLPYDVRGKTWSLHYNHAFVDPGTGELRRPLTNYVYDDYQLQQIKNVTIPSQEKTGLPYPDAPIFNPNEESGIEDFVNNGFRPSATPGRSKISADNLVTASVSQIAIDDFFVWVWMTSLSGEATEVLKANFGRSLVVELNVSSGEAGRRWVIVEEVLYPACPPLKVEEPSKETPLEKYSRRVVSAPIKQERPRTEKKPQHHRSEKKKKAKEPQLPTMPREVHEVYIPPPIQDIHHHHHPFSYASLDPLVEAVAKRLERRQSKNGGHGEEGEGKSAEDSLQAVDACVQTEDAITNREQIPHTNTSVSTVPMPPLSPAHLTVPVSVPAPDSSQESLETQSIYYTPSMPATEEFNHLPEIPALQPLIDDQESDDAEPDELFDSPIAPNNFDYVRQRSVSETVAITNTAWTPYQESQAPYTSGGSEHNNEAIANREIASQGPKQNSYNSVVASVQPLSGPKSLSMVQPDQSSLSPRPLVESSRPYNFLPPQALALSKPNTDLEKPLPPTPPLMKSPTKSVKFNEKSQTLAQPEVQRSKSTGQVYKSLITEIEDMERDMAASSVSRSNSSKKQTQSNEHEKVGEVTQPAQTSVRKTSMNVPRKPVGSTPKIATSSTSPASPSSASTPALTSLTPSFPGRPPGSSQQAAKIPGGYRETDSSDDSAKNKQYRGSPRYGPDRNANAPFNSMGYPRLPGHSGRPRDSWGSYISDYNPSIPYRGYRAPASDFPSDLSHDGLHISMRRGNNGGGSNNGHPRPPHLPQDRFLSPPPSVILPRSRVSSDSGGFSPDSPRDYSRVAPEPMYDYRGYPRDRELRDRDRYGERRGYPHDYQRSRGPSRDEPRSRYRDQLSVEDLMMESGPMGPMGMKMPKTKPRFPRSSRSSPQYDDLYSPRGMPYPSATLVGSMRSSENRYPSRPRSSSNGDVFPAPRSHLDDNYDRRANSLSEGAPDPRYDRLPYARNNSFGSRSGTGWTSRSASVSDAELSREINLPQKTPLASSSVPLTSARQSSPLSNPPQSINIAAERSNKDFQGESNSTELRSASNNVSATSDKWKQVKENLHNMRNQRSDDNNLMLPAVLSQTPRRITSAQSAVAGTVGPDDYYNATVANIRRPSISTGAHVTPIVIKDNHREDLDGVASPVYRYGTEQDVGPASYEPNFSSQPQLRHTRAPSLANLESAYQSDSSATEFFNGPMYGQSQFSFDRSVVSVSVPATPLAASGSDARELRKRSEKIARKPVNLVPNQMEQHPPSEPIQSIQGPASSQSQHAHAAYSYDNQQPKPNTISYDYNSYERSFGTNSDSMYGTNSAAVPPSAAFDGAAQQPSSSGDKVSRFSIMGIVGAIKGEK